MFGKDFIMFLSLVSGSSGNASLAKNENTTILIDCGLSAKRLCSLLDEININPNEIDAILITHEHSDHITGAGVMSRRFDIPVYATQNTHQSMDIGPIRDYNTKIIDKGCDFEIGSFVITPFSISHDAADPVCYSLNDNKEKYSILTDTGIISNEILKSVAESDYIMLEANHDVDMLMYGNYPFNLKRRIASDKGHMSNDYAAQCAIKLIENNTKNIMLSHLSNNNNTPEIAYKTIEDVLSKNDIKIGRDIKLSVANRYEVTRFI